LLPNGKVNKHKLPRRDTEYEPPLSGAETQIAEAFADILGAERVGATTDYFSLGGDSLAATALSIELSDILGKSVEPGMFLDAPTPRALARLLETHRNDGFAPFPAAPPLRSFDLTPQQRRYLRTFVAGGNRNWCNMLAIFDLPDNTSWSEVSTALHEISVHHDSLRLGFEIAEDGITRQSICPNSNFTLEDIDLEGLSSAEVPAEIGRLKLAEAERPIPVYSDSTLFRASLLRLPEGGRKLLWNVHHLVSDGTSQGILGRLLSEWLASSQTFRENYADLPSFRDLAHVVNAQA
jgi:acyl carrier protein